MILLRALCLVGKVVLLSAATSALGAATPAHAHAQTAPAADSACTYERCALRLEGRRLLRGLHDERVTESRIFTPRRLLPFVTGDSARLYASRYERDARRASLLSGVGALLLLGAYVGTRNLSSECGPSEGCAGHDALRVASGAAAVGAIVSFGASLRFGFGATRAESRALWWHNAQFAR
jgi:hypothetical protein